MENSNIGRLVGANCMTHSTRARIVMHPKPRCIPTDNFSFGAGRNLKRFVIRLGFHDARTALNLSRNECDSTNGEFGTNDNTLDGPSFHLTLAFTLDDLEHPL